MRFGAPGRQIVFALNSNRSFRNGGLDKLFGFDFCFGNMVRAPRQSGYSITIDGRLLLAIARTYPRLSAGNEGSIRPALVLRSRVVVFRYLFLHLASKGYRADHKTCLRNSVT